MAVVHALYERFRQIIHEFAKFGVIGVIGLFITNIGYALLHGRFGMGPVSATSVATVVAACVTYVGNRYWSFKHRERTGVPRETVIFFALNGIGLLIQDGVVAFNYYILGLSHNKLAQFLALNAGIGLATMFRFWSYRQFVWVSPIGGRGTTAAAGTTALPDQPLAAGPDRRYPAVETAPGGIQHANGHDVAGRKAGDGSYSRS